MTREEWLELPPLAALAALYDLVPALARTKAPSIPRPPKYDGKFPRKKGLYCWLSEMTLDDLKWWRSKKQESVESGGQYAEKDAKMLKSLDAWIAWRTFYPNDTWIGTRGDDRATGKPPSRDAALHEWDNSGRSNGGGSSRSEPKADPIDDAPIDEEDIPF